MERQVNVTEAAKLIGVNRRTLYNWRKRGYGPTAYLHPTYSYYLRDEVEQFAKKWRGQWEARQ